MAGEKPGENGDNNPSPEPPAESLPAPVAPVVPEGPPNEEIKWDSPKPREKEPGEG